VSKCHKWPRHERDLTRTFVGGRFSKGHELLANECVGFFALLISGHGPLLGYMYNIWSWPFYYKILGFDICTTQHSISTFLPHNILTFLLHNIWFWPFYYSTLGFDRFLHNPWFWPLYYTTFDFDLSVTQHSILTFLLNNIWFWPFYYTTFDFELLTTQLLVSTVLLHQTRFWPVAGTTVCEVHVLEVECTKNQNSVGTTTTWYQRVYQETSVWWDSVPQNQILRYGVQKYPTSKIESKVT